MERIGDILARGLNSQKPIPSHHTTPPSTNLTDEELAEKRARINRHMNVNPEHDLKSIVDVPGMREAVRSVKLTIAGRRPLCLIYGGVGNGKTRLLEAATIEFYRQGRLTRRQDWGAVLDSLRRSIGNKDNPGLYQIILDSLCYTEAPIILDDIGASGTDTDFGDRILESIVCSRYGRQLTTLMTTNRDITTLPERVLSRLKDRSQCYLVLNRAPDYRPQMRAR